LNLGPVLRKTNRPQEARENYDQAIAILKKLADQYPHHPEYRHDLGVCFLNLGNLLADNPPPLPRADGRRQGWPAEQAYAEALKLFHPLASDFPRVPMHRQELANTYNSLGSFLVHKESVRRDLNALAVLFAHQQPLPVATCSSYLQTPQKRDLSAAQASWEQALKLFDKLAAERPNVPAHQADLGMAHGNLGWLFTAQDDWAAAGPQLVKAVACLKKALKPPNAQNPDYLNALRGHYQTQAETALQLKDPVGAAQAAAALPEVFGNRGLDYYYAACFTARCVPLAAQPAVKRFCTDQAIDLLRRAVVHGVARDKRLRDIEQNYLVPLRPAVVAKLLTELD
jgi:tetratricopeptide (TPR) repeat protein